MGDTLKHELDTLKSELNTLKERSKQNPNDFDLYEQIDTLQDEIIEKLREIMREQAKELGALTVTTRWATYPNCHISLNNYSADGSLCVELWNNEDGTIARLTTCLSDKSLKGKGANYSYLDGNNCPWAMDFIETYGLGKNTWHIKISGYCFYPLIEWNMEELKNYE